MTSAPRQSEPVTREPDANAAFVGRQESPHEMTVRDALVYHMGERATPAEAIDAVLLILDDTSTHAMAELGVRKCLHELAQTGQVRSGAASAVLDAATRSGWCMRWANYRSEHRETPPVG